MIQTIKSCFSRLHPDRLTAVVLAAALLLTGLAACGSGQGGEAKTLRVGVALYDQEDTFITTIAPNMERMAQEAEREEGIKLTLFTTDGKSNQTTQLEQVDRMLDRGCDVLCVNIVDRTAAAVVVDKAEEAEVPLIFFNRQPVAEDIQRWDRTYYVGTRAEEGGSFQGELVLDAWLTDREHLDRNGDGVLQYVMLEGERGHQDTLLRTEYSVKVLTDAGVPVEKLASDTANWNRGEAAAKMERWLAEFGPEIEVVFANNDDMALGAIDVFKSAGAELPLVVGVDVTAPALEAMKAGDLYATVLNDAQGIARAMMDLVLALNRGEDPAQTMELEEGHYVWLPCQKVTQQNLEDFLAIYRTQ